MKAPSISGRIESDTRIKAERLSAQNLKCPDTIKLVLVTGAIDLTLFGYEADMIRLRDALNTVLAEPDGETIDEQ